MKCMCSCIMIVCLTSVKITDLCSFVFEFAFPSSAYGQMLDNKKGIKIK